MPTFLESMRNVCMPEGRFEWKRIIIFWFLLTVVGGSLLGWGCSESFQAVFSDCAHRTGITLSGFVITALLVAAVLLPVAGGLLLEANYGIAIGVGVAFIGFFITLPVALIILNARSLLEAMLLPLAVIFCALLLFMKLTKTPIISKR